MALVEEDMDLVLEEQEDIEILITLKHLVAVDLLKLLLHLHQAQHIQLLLVLVAVMLKVVIVHFQDQD